MVESVRYVSEQTPDDEERAVIGDRGGVRGGLGPGRSRGAQRRASKDRKEDVQCWLLGGLRSEYPQPDYAHAPHVTMTVTYVSRVELSLGSDG